MEIFNRIIVALFGLDVLVVNVLLIFYGILMVKDEEIVGWVTLFLELFALAGMFILIKPFFVFIMGR